ncbi:MAG: ImmA/IrrE family metallo-endopeptidase [Desulfobacterales bacterium]|nr:ImmA/IrrE family metallo-endopeptidase [Desulfobacterales bacterium]
MEDYSKFKCPYLEKREIWQIAENFRAKFWPESTLPVDIESIIEKRLKLNIEPEHDLLSDCDIDAYLQIDLTGIVVDNTRYMDERFGNRLRFSFAHELGHLFLHKEIYKTFAIKEPSDWKEFMLNISEREYNFFEYQANEFAGRVLVPRDRLLSELEICLNKIQKIGMLDYLASDPGIVLSSISTALCKPFGISDQVIERRVEREEIWPPKIEYINGGGVKLQKF